MAAGASQTGSGHTGARAAARRRGPKAAFTSYVGFQQRVPLSTPRPTGHSGLESGHRVTGGLGSGASCPASWSRALLTVLALSIYPLALQFSGRFRLSPVFVCCGGYHSLLGGGPVAGCGDLDTPRSVPLEETQNTIAVVEAPAAWLGNYCISIEELFTALQRGEVSHCCSNTSPPWGAWPWLGQLVTSLCPGERSRVFGYGSPG